MASTGNERLPRWPHYHLTHADDETVTVHGLGPDTTHPDRATAVEHITKAAERIGRPVPATATDADGTQWPLTIHPDGTVTSAGPATTPRRRKTKKPRTPKPTPPSDTTAPVLKAPPVRKALPAASTHTAVPSAYQTIATLVSEDRHRDAAHVAGQLDDALAGQHGPSHPETLAARETRATLLASVGDLAAAIGLFRDIAERYALQGDTAAASSLADRAQEIWHEMPHDQALTTGPAIIRMRNHIPGSGGSGYQAATTHLARLQQGQLTQAVPPGSSRE